MKNKHRSLRKKHILEEHFRWLLHLNSYVLYTIDKIDKISLYKIILLTKSIAGLLDIAMGRSWSYLNCVHYH